MDCITLINSDTFKPSSIIKAKDKYFGMAPHMATSFTVPCTANSPIFPPLKKMGVTVEKKLNKKRLSKIAKWIGSDNSIEVNYKDNTEDIFESILLPYYNLTILPTILS